MVSGRLKDIIYKKLCKDLSHVEIIEYKGEIWFIDREDKFWYFIYNKSNGEMWWRYSFFIPFFSLFSLPSDDFTFILSSWVEEVLNHKVTSSGNSIIIRDKKVDEVLNHKVTTTIIANCLLNIEVEEVLNHKVTTTQGKKHQFGYRVDEVLNCKVTTTSIAHSNLTLLVDEVLNHKVTTTEVSYEEIKHEVEEVLSYKINKTGGAFYNTTCVEEVLNHNVENKEN